MGAPKENRKNEIKSRLHIENHSQKIEQKKVDKTGSAGNRQQGHPSYTSILSFIFCFLYALHFLYAILPSNQPFVRCSLLEFSACEQISPAKKYRHKYKHTHAQDSLSSWFSLFIFLFLVSFTK